MKQRLIFYLLLAISLPAFTMTISVNKSIHIDDHHRHGSCSTVNGSITVGNECKISGGLRSVNGSVRVGNDCALKSVHTVNGSIKIAKDANIRGTLASVNGNVHCKHGSKISKNIDTVNGSIRIYDTKVGDDITTINGNISLFNGSIVHHDIIIKDNKGNNNREKPLYILIDSNSVVKGDIINREEDIKVIVQIKDGGRVEGRTKNVIIERD